jgi:antitoxin component YwqK of YwqJK toxin-antitoxin module
MAQKEHLLSRFILLIVCVFTFGCSTSKDEKANNIFEVVDISQIPDTTIFENDTILKLLNGVYHFGGEPFSGFIKAVYETDTLKSVGSYFQGKQHGATQTFFPNGKLESVRNYKNGMSYGQHLGYWRNGNLKFDFNYFNDKREGVQKQWYETGSQYCELSFKDDRESGMQKAWRENGKPYINYEVKDGVRYGLQKSALCYTLKNGQLK